MSDYITFAQLAGALRGCGSGQNADDCKGCALYDSLAMRLCIPKMTERAAQVIELFVTEPMEEGEKNDV